MIGRFQEPLEGSVERTTEIAAVQHEIGRDKYMVGQRLEGRLDLRDLLVRSILRGERGQAGGGQRVEVSGRQGCIGVAADPVDIEAGTLAEPNRPVECGMPRSSSISSPRRTLKGRG
ncbi:MULTISPECIES: hypothetical protein [Mesorhizobium]|uniref:hypothetical protein n=1 Tax=Mesorhizobium TaxID=68287 RepID=UPI001FD9535F|nr:MULTISPECIES: hypothetical protein [Mesorhizobium]